MKAKILLLAVLLSGVAAHAQTSVNSLAGRWDAVATTGDVAIPFRFDISTDGKGIAGTFFNGDEKFTSTSGTLDSGTPEAGTLTLKWDYYAATLQATVKNGVLEGTYRRQSRARGGPTQIRATRHQDAAASAAKGPAIDGLWEIPAKSSKGEAAWRFIVQQQGAEVSAAILRVDGDTGAFTGGYRDGKFQLSHFDGSRSGVMEVVPQADGTLNVTAEGGQFTALRPAAARAKGLPEPTDPTRHTGVKDKSQAFAFNFPDLNGKQVANTDARFEGKVVLVNITGSWCPNCHDEAPFLSEIYKKYKSKGLEVVALNFEEEEQLKDPARLRAFIKKYGLEYTVLLCGEPGEAAAKLSQAENWNSWPTTFFLDRQGKVQYVHAGFPSNGSGDLYTKAKEEFTAKVEELLAK
jgi:thiol-disulfide isomerase/thioredoxin